MSSLSGSSDVHNNCGVQPNLPIELWDNIFNKMPVKDVLKFGAIGSAARILVTQYHPKLLRRCKNQKVVFQNPSQFLTFVHNVKLSTASKFEFIFEAQEFSHVPEISAFVETFGSQVKSLSLANLAVPLSMSDVGLFRRLTNLEELRVGILTSTDTAFVNCTPSCLDNVTQFRFGQISMPSILRPMMLYFRSLTSVSLGPIESASILNAVMRNTLEQQLATAIEIVTHQNSGSPIEVNFENCASDRNCQMILLTRFVNIMAQNPVRISGLTADFCRRASENSDIPRQVLERFYNKILTVNGYNFILCNVGFQALEEINLAFNNSNIDELLQLSEEPQENNSNTLKRIKFEVSISHDVFNNFGLINQEVDPRRVAIENLHRSVFNQRRRSVVQLTYRVHFSNVYLAPETLFDGLANLNTLCFDSASYTGTDLVKMFSVLAEHNSLVSLKLNVRWRAFTVMFVGYEPEIPVFSRLTKLRHCQIGFTNCDRVPGSVSDRIFVDVISQMSLTCLSFYFADSRVFRVTLAGLNSIRNGQINQSLRHFEIIGCSLVGLHRAYGEIQDITKQNRKMCPSFLLVHQDGCNKCSS